MSRKTTSKGQITRIKDDILPRLRDSIAGFELALKEAEGQSKVPFSYDALGALQTNVGRLIFAVAQHDAALSIEREADKKE